MLAALHMLCGVAALLSVFCKLVEQNEGVGSDFIALMLGVLVVWVLYRSRPDIFQGKHPILRGLLGGETDEIWRFLCYRIFFLSVREREKINREITKVVIFFQYFYYLKFYTNKKFRNFYHHP